MQSQEEAKAASLLANKSNEPNKKNQKVENPVDSFKSKSKEQPEVKSQSSKKKETNSAAQRQKKSHSEEKMKNQQLKASESVFQNDFNIVYVEEEGEIIEEEASASPNVAQRSTSKTQPDWKALVTSPDSEEEFTLGSGLGEKLKTTISMKRETSRTPSPGGKRPNILQKAKTPASSTSKNESRLPPNSYAAKLLNASASSGKKESEKQMTFDDIVKCARPPSHEKATEDGEASINVRERPAAKTYDFDEDKDGLRSNSPTPNRFPSFSNKLLNNPKPIAQMRMKQQKLSKEIELMSNHVVTEWSEPINFDYTQVLEELLQKEKDQNKATAEQVRLNARVQWKRPIPLTSFKNIKKLANITANSSISPTPRLDYSPKAGRASDSRSPYQNRDSDDRDIIAVPDESGRNSSHDIFDVTR